MRFRTVRIMIAKGKARLLYTVSMLLLPLISWAQNDNGKTENGIDVRFVLPVRANTPDIRVMYGVPPVSDNNGNDTVSRRDLNYYDMPLMYGPPSIFSIKTEQKTTPLIVLDGNIAECDSTLLENFNFDRDIYFSGNLAELLGIKASSIKGVRPLMQSTAMQFWGTRGANGVVEIYTKKYYRKNRSSLKDNYTKVLKGKSVLYL